MSVDDSGDSLAIPLTSAGIAASSSGGTVRSTAGMSKEEIKELKKLEKQEKRPRAAKMMLEEFKHSQQNEVFIGEIEHRNVYFGSEEDLALFNEIKAYREERPTEDMNKSAFGLFCARPNGDAIVKVVYRSRHPDYVIKVVEKESYKGKFTPIRALFEKKLLKAGLVIVHDTYFDTEDIYVLVFTPFQLLLKVAEERGINFELIQGDEPPTKTGWALMLDFFLNKIEPEPSAPFRTAKIEQFKGSDSDHKCVGSDPEETLRKDFFRKSLRQLLTWHVITHTTLKLNELKSLSSLPFKPSSRFSINHMLAKGIYTQFFPIHDGSMKSKQEHPNLRTQLKHDWSLAPFTLQPLDKIRSYFGERVALYFAFIGFYTWWLVIASVIGIIATLYGIGQSYSTGSFDSAVLFDNGFSIPFAAFMSIWATMYLEFWKRRQNLLSWWWDMMDFEEQEATRPEWYATSMRTSPITGKNELYYPESRRMMKMIASFACVFVGVVIVLASVTATIVYRVWAVNNIGQCTAVNGTETYCVPSYASSGNVIPDTFITACQDSCWFSTTEANCNGTGPIFSAALPAGTDVPACEWFVPVNGSAYCRPACEQYLNGVTCNNGYNPTGQANGSFPYLTLPGYRSTCSFVDPTYGSTISASFISLVVIQFFKLFFPAIATALNDWENHKTDTIYEDALIAKSFFFDFLNSYTTLFYIAFFKGTLGGSLFGSPLLVDHCLYGGCLTELLIQLVTLFCGTQFIMKITDVLIPYVKTLIRSQYEQKEKEEMQKLYDDFTANERDSNGEAVDPSNEMQKPPQWIKDEKLEPGFDLFYDYAWLATQFGYMTLFVVAFPLAPLAGLLNNIIEIRTDSYRLITRFQRPPAREAEDIGTWYYVLKVLSLMAVITNAFIVAFSSSWVSNTIGASIPGYTPTWIQGYQALNNVNDVKLPLLAYRLVIVIVFEHAVFFLQLMIAWFVPDVPAPVVLAIEREKYLAKILIDGEAEEIPLDDDDEKVFERFESIA